VGYLKQPWWIEADDERYIERQEELLGLVKLDNWVSQILAVYRSNIHQPEAN
jgi:hypothetical protein